jgi:acyl-coenzyme A synthetase/AMP-(fatty) acid ligase
VSRPDDLVGEAIVAFVTLKSGFTGDDTMAEELRDHVAQMIGKIARPHGIIFTNDLPKTRSGKILRGTMKKIADGLEYGVPATIDDPATLGEITGALKRIGYPKTDPPR